MESWRMLIKADCHEAQFSPSACWSSTAQVWMTTSEGVEAAQSKFVPQRTSEKQHCECC